MWMEKIKIIKSKRTVMVVLVKDHISKWKSKNLKKRAMLTITLTLSKRWTRLPSKKKTKTIQILKKMMRKRVPLKDKRRANNIWKKMIKINRIMTKRNSMTLKTSRRSPRRMTRVQPLSLCHRKSRRLILGFKEIKARSHQSITKMGSFGKRKLSPRKGILLYKTLMEEKNKETKKNTRTPKVILTNLISFGVHKRMPASILRAGFKWQINQLREGEVDPLWVQTKLEVSLRRLKSTKFRRATLGTPGIKKLLIILWFKIIWDLSLSRACSHQTKMSSRNIQT